MSEISMTVLRALRFHDAINAKDLLDAIGIENNFRIRNAYNVALGRHVRRGYCRRLQEQRKPQYRLTEAGLRIVRGR